MTPPVGFILDGSSPAPHHPEKPYPSIGDPVNPAIEPPPGVELSSDFLSLLHHARGALGLYVIDRDEWWLLNCDEFADERAEFWRESLLTRLHPTTLDSFEEVLSVDEGSRVTTVKLDADPSQTYALTASLYQAGVLCLTLHSKESTKATDETRFVRILEDATAAASMGREVRGQLIHITQGIDEAWATLRRALDLAADGIGANFYLRMIEESLGMLELSLEGSQRARDLISQLQTFAGEREADQPTRIDCGELLANCAKLTHEATRNRVIVEVTADDELMIRARRAEITHALVNLIEDIARRIPRGTTEDHTIALRGTRKDGEVEISLQSTLRCDHRELQKSLEFDPLGATGGEFRLQVAAHLIEANHGAIEACESPDRSIFRLRFPLQTGDAAAAIRNRSILIVDDEPTLLSVLKRQLEDTWDVLTLDDAPDAVTTIRNGPERFDIILCDLTMRAMSGLRIYNAVTNTNPELAGRFLFMTGGEFTPESEVFSEALSDRVLMKPFSKGDLLTTIDLIELQARERSRSDGGH